MEFLTGVDAVRGEERHIRAPILEERKRLPQDPVGAEGRGGATIIGLSPGLDPSTPSSPGGLRAVGLLPGLLTSRGRSEQPHRAKALGDHPQPPSSFLAPQFPLLNKKNAIFAFRHVGVRPWPVPWLRA